MASLGDIRELSIIARQGGTSALAIDTDEERAQAMAFIASLLQSGNLDFFERPLVTEALQALEDHPRARLQVNPVFGERDVVSRKIGLFEPPFDIRKPHIPLLAPLAAGARHSITVFYSTAGEGDAAEHVSLPEEEWAAITAPLTVKASRSPDQERAALARAVARFEEIAGPKVKTSDDRGGWVGNMALFGYENASLSRQQVCFEESKTTAQLLSLLDKEGLLRYHRQDPDDAFAQTPHQEHISAQLIETSSNTPIVVDSWVRDNGEEPFIGDVASWVSFLEQL